MHPRCRSPWLISLGLLLVIGFVWLPGPVPVLRAADKNDDLAAQLRQLDARVILQGTIRGAPLAPMLARDLQAGLRAANQRETRAWDGVKTRADWERFRDLRLQALRAALGSFPPAPK